MAFLGGFLTEVLKWFLPALGGWILKELHVAWQDYQEKKTAEAATKKAIDADKAANTPTERDNAAKGIADNV